MGTTASAEGTSAGPVDDDEEDFLPIMMPPTWSQGPTSPLASLSQIRSSWSAVVAGVCVDGVMDDEGRLAAAVMVGFFELLKELVGGEAVVGWVVDEGWIASGFFVSSKELVEKVVVKVAEAGVQSASRFCIVRALSGQICGTGKVRELAAPNL